MKLKHSFFLACLLCGQTLLAQDNQIKNPGFENKAEDWNLFGGAVTDLAHDGIASFKVSQEKPSWAGADQVLRLPKGTSTIEAKGWMKIENVVKGVEDWEKARIAIEFMDANGNITGGYPPVVGNGEGSSGWEHFENTYDVPEEATQVKLQLALANCVGTAYFDDVELYIKGANGENLKALKATGPADWGTWYAIPIDPTRTGGHYVDWSSLLDKPAGKHGYAKAKDGKIVFEDGAPARFWGTNLMGSNCFLEKKQADSLALRLSRMGCNLLRLHHMDAPWAKPNIFGNAENTLTLSRTYLDKLDYLVSALKKKGIYVFLDLLVHREFKKEDGVGLAQPDLGGKQVGYFDDRLIELQKQYIKQLLTHKNAYTGLAYKDEPAIIGSEFINESSVFVHFAGDQLTPEYRQMLQEKFEADPKNAGKTLAVFDLDYSTFISPTLKQRTGDKGDLNATFVFLSNMEKNYYKTLSDYMRGLGVKYLLSGSNFPTPILAYQRDNTQMELISTNDYWDHPQLWKMNNDWARIDYAPIYNNSIYKNYPKGPINNLSKYRWKDKPMVVTEFNVCFPNEFRLEGLPYIAAYSRLQGWDGMMQFHFDPAPTGVERNLHFALNNMPEHLAHWVVAAPLFLRGDVQEAPSFVADNVTDKQAYSLPSYSDFIDKNDFLPLVTKVGKQTVETATEASVDAFRKFVNEQKKIIRSETNELTLNKTQGIFKINAPKVQGVVGTLKDSVFEFPAMTVSVKNPWASVLAIAIDNKPLAQSGHYYLVIATPVRTKGMLYNDSRNALKSTGEYVLQAQAAAGTVAFKAEGRKVTVTPLNISGSKEKAQLLQDNKLNLISQKSFVFEVVVE